MSERIERGRKTADKAPDHQDAGYSGSTNSVWVGEESSDNEGNDDVFDLGDLFGDVLDINVDDILHNSIDDEDFHGFASQSDDV